MKLLLILSALVTTIIASPCSRKVTITKSTCTCDRSYYPKIVPASWVVKTFDSQCATLAFRGQWYLQMATPVGINGQTALRTGLFSTCYPSCNNRVFFWDTTPECPGDYNTDYIMLDCSFNLATQRIEKTKALLKGAYGSTCSLAIFNVLTEKYYPTPATDLEDLIDDALNKHQCSGNYKRDYTLACIGADNCFQEYMVFGIINKYDNIFCGNKYLIWVFTRDIEPSPKTYKKAIDDIIKSGLCPKYLISIDQSVVLSDVPTVSDDDINGVVEKTTVTTTTTKSMTTYTDTDIDADYSTSSSTTFTTVSTVEITKNVEYTIQYEYDFYEYCGNVKILKNLQPSVIKEALSGLYYLYLATPCVLAETIDAKIGLLNTALPGCSMQIIFDTHNDGPWNYDVPIMMMDRGLNAMTGDISMTRNILGSAYDASHPFGTFMVFSEGYYHDVISKVTTINTEGIIMQSPGKLYRESYMVCIAGYQSGDFLLITIADTYNNLFYDNDDVNLFYVLTRQRIVSQDVIESINQELCRCGYNSQHLISIDQTIEITKEFKFEETFFEYSYTKKTVSSTSVYVDEYPDILNSSDLKPGGTQTSSLSVSRSIFPKIPDPSSNPFSTLLPKTTTRSISPKPKSLSESYYIPPKPKLPPISRFIAPLPDPSPKPSFIDPIPNPKSVTHYITPEPKSLPESCHIPPKPKPSTTSRCIVPLPDPSLTPSFIDPVPDPQPTPHNIAPEPKSRSETCHISPIPKPPPTPHFIVPLPDPSPTLTFIDPVPDPQPTPHYIAPEPKSRSETCHISPIPKPPPTPHFIVPLPDPSPTPSFIDPVPDPQPTPHYIAPEPKCRSETCHISPIPKPPPTPHLTVPLPDPSPTPTFIDPVPDPQPTPHYIAPEPKSRSETCHISPIPKPPPTPSCIDLVHDPQPIPQYIPHEPKCRSETCHISPILKPSPTPHFIVPLPDPSPTLSFIDPVPDPQPTPHYIAPIPKPYNIGSQESYSRTRSSSFSQTSYSSVSQYELPKICPTTWKIKTFDSQCATQLFQGKWYLQTATPLSFKSQYAIRTGLFSNCHPCSNNRVLFFDTTPENPGDYNTDYYMIDSSFNLATQRIETTQSLLKSAYGNNMAIFSVVTQKYYPIPLNNLEDLIDDDLIAHKCDDIYEREYILTVIGCDDIWNEYMVMVVINKYDNIYCGNGYIIWVFTRDVNPSPKLYEKAFNDIKLSGLCPKYLMNIDQSVVLEDVPTVTSDDIDGVIQTTTVTTSTTKSTTTYINSDVDSISNSTTTTTTTTISTVEITANVDYIISYDYDFYEYCGNVKILKNLQPDVIKDALSGKWYVNSATPSVFDESDDSKIGLFNTAFPSCSLEVIFDSSNNCPWETPIMMLDRGYNAITGDISMTRNIWAPAFDGSHPFGTFMVSSEGYYHDVMPKVTDITPKGIIMESPSKLYRDSYMACIAGYQSGDFLLITIADKFNNLFYDDDVNLFYVLTRQRIVPQNIIETINQELCRCGYSSKYLISIDQTVEITDDFSFDASYFEYPDTSTVTTTTVTTTTSSRCLITSCDSEYFDN